MEGSSGLLLPHKHCISQPKSSAHKVVVIMPEFCPVGLRTVLDMTTNIEA